MTVAPRTWAQDGTAAAIVVAVLALGVLGVLGMTLTGDARRLATDIGVLAMASGAVVSCLFAARRQRGRARVGWLTLAGAGGSWTAGQLVWAVQEHVLDMPTHFPSLADIGFLGFPLAAVCGLVCLVPAGSSLATPRRVLDALVIGCAIGLVAWVTVLDSVTGDPALPRVTLSILYPIANAVLLTATVLACAQARDQPLLWGLLGGAMLTMAAADTAAVYLFATGELGTDGLAPWGWRIAFVLLAVAGVVARARPAPPALDAVTPGVSTGAAVAPYLPLAAAAVLVAIDAATDDGLDTIEVGLVAALVLLVLARQYVTVRENQELTRAVQEREAALHRLAFHDNLTGLANRALFLDRLEHALNRAERSRRSVSVGFLDLDGFKAVNDTLGHAAGDTLLIGVAERLRSVLRSADTLARLGGDEFAVLVEQGDDATTAARRLLATLREPFHVGGRSVEVSASIGVATVDAGQDAGGGIPTATRAATLLHRADVAMYAVKASGKGAVATHSSLPSGSDGLLGGRHTVRRLQPSLPEAFGAALQRNEVHAIYQPVVDPGSGRISALEVLARWTHEGVAVPPSEFIPASAQAGLSGQLTTLMLEQACAQLGAWNAGLSHRRLRIAVNIDSTEIGDEALPDRVAAVLRRHGVSPGQLMLEMTETGVTNRPADAVDVLHALRDLGVRVALDDFGTGYSSLSRLARVPVHTVKIDQGFVAHIDHDEQQRWFLRGLLDLARHLGLQTVAEGVERAGQLHELRRQGCDLVQGYFVARPATGGRLTPIVLADQPILPPQLRGIRPSPHRMAAGRWFRSVTEPG